MKYKRRVYPKTLDPSYPDSVGENIFLWEFGPGWLTSFISSLFMKLDFISQPSSNSTLPFRGLQNTQQCQVNSTQLLLQALDPNGKWSPQWGGLNPRPLSHESSALTTRPWLLAIVGETIFLLLVT
jgi:hypothetical protein